MAETVLFVCPHGAGKSRVAAAWFNGSAPPGSAGDIGRRHAAGGR
jgi:protein-tyrosine-phosphatase